MEMLTSVVPFGLLGGALAAALWAWHEIRDVAMGGNAGASAPPRAPDASAMRLSSSATARSTR